MPLDLMICDMDGSIVKYEDGNFQSSWDALGRAVGLYEQWQGFVDKYLPHPELYPEWVADNCASLKGIEVQPALDQIFPPPYACGFSAFMEYVKSWSAKKVLLSGGVSLIADKIQEEFGFDQVIANDIHVENGYFTGTGTVNVPIDGKGEILRRLIAENETSSDRVLYIGDHLNDIPAWKEAGHALGVDVKKDEMCSLS